MYFATALHRDRPRLLDQFRMIRTMLDAPTVKLLVILLLMLGGLVLEVLKVLVR